MINVKYNKFNIIITSEQNLQKKILKKLLSIGN